MKINHKVDRSQSGFSLIELMIVIAIIGILVSVGIPAWKMMIRRANETAAIQTITTLKQVQADYLIGHRGDYGTFDELVKGGALDQQYAGDAPVLNGYVYTMKITKKSNTSPASYTINADPQVADGYAATGKRHFYFDPSLSTTRENADQPATASDPPIGQ
jgi:prepilin-type N-terminal cleavage/methylation domain-containing protein